MHRVSDYPGIPGATQCSEVMRQGIALRCGTHWHPKVAAALTPQRPRLRVERQIHQHVVIEIHRAVVIEVTVDPAVKDEC
jgi:hypothetical protein